MSLFSHLQNGGNHRTHGVGLLEVNELLCVKCLEQCWLQRKPSKCDVIIHSGQQGGIFLSVERKHCGPA